MLRSAIMATIIVAMTVFQAVGEDISFHVSTAPEWNQMFQSSNGWIGADVAYSVPLGPEKRLWLFGDTFVGQIRNGKRKAEKMIHSSIAIQEQNDRPRFYFPVNKKHAPESFIQSPGPRTYFWLGDGVRTKEALYFFLQEVKWINDTAWGFNCVGTWLVCVENPDDDPANWKMTKYKLPFADLADGQVAILGAEILKTDDYIYIYGYSNRTNSTSMKNQIVARARPDEFGDSSSWEFCSNGFWTKDFDKVAAVFSGTGAEGSVSWQPFLKKFVFIYSDGIGGAIDMRTAMAPEGPWSTPIKLYQCPERKISPSVFCYAAKGHPEVSETNELLISYASNSESFSEVMNNPRIYVPRFIRLTFDAPGFAN
jgi:hypothetical protein